MLSIINEAIELLPTIRADRGTWARWSYREVVHPEFGRQDANSQERHRYLIALQYEHLPNDEMLVRNLFDQEVIARRRDDFQGFGEALLLASFLLSRWKRRGDFWHYAEAKFANFDTCCGYDSRYLFAIGRDAALAELASTEHELKEKTRELLFDDQGKCRFTSEEIHAWEQERVAEHPKKPEDEPLIVWVRRAIMFQQQTEGRTLLDRLEESHTEIPVNSLAYMREQLEDFKAAIRLRRRIVTSAGDEWERLSNEVSVVDLLIKDGRPDEAWTTICDFQDRLMQLEGWNDVGLGRKAVELAFQIAMDASAENRLSAFEWACCNESKLKSSTLQIMRLAIQASVACGDTVRCAHYQRAADAEQVQIDRMLS